MNDRKKFLKEQYKQMRPVMGVLALRNLQTGRRFLEASADIPSMFNRIQFQLDMGMHPNRDLQQDWKALGKAGFAFETVDTLEYSKDESKTDYKEDLQTLKDVWLEKLSHDSKMEFY